MNTQGLEARAADTLKALLDQVPLVKQTKIELETSHPDRGIDIQAHVTVSNRQHLLVCEVKANGQPRYVRPALLQLRNYISHLGGEATPILIAPYLSPSAQSLCRDQGISYVDLEGNARIAFNGVFIERIAQQRPSSSERRELRSLFKPKSAQVLRAMLHDPTRAWRVAELAEAAGVSLGHASNVRNSLLDREWAKVSDKGLWLSDPDALLDAWRDAYDSAADKRMTFYTALHGKLIEQASRQATLAAKADGHAAFASFSAAQWLAPYGRNATQYFYADENGLKHLRAALNLSSTAKGENVVINIPKDDGIFRDTIEPVPGVVCTSAVQTYLDLSSAGERGQEAAAHLRQQKLNWRASHNA